MVYMILVMLVTYIDPVYIPQREPALKEKLVAKSLTTVKCPVLLTSLSSMKVLSLSKDELNGDSDAIGTFN